MRSICNCIIADHTILFTTHHMDEADLLSDRIFVISRGILVCAGSNVFLKNRFGSGYRLVLVKRMLDPSAQNRTPLLSPKSPEPTDRPESSPASVNATPPTLHPSGSVASTLATGLVAPGSTVSVDVEAISALVRTHVPDAELSDNSSSELVYLLPSATDDHSAATQYIGLFRELDGTCAAALFDIFDKRIVSVCCSILLYMYCIDEYIGVGILTKEIEM